MRIPLEKLSKIEKGLLRPKIEFLLALRMMLDGARPPFLGEILRL